MARKVLGAAAVAVAVGSLSVVGVGPVAPAAGASAAERAGDRAAQWRAGAPMPEGRAEMGVAALDGRVYVVGGTVQRGDDAPEFTTTLVTSYDPRADRWSQHAPLPRPLTHVGVAVLDGKLYAFGGFTDIVHLDPQQAAFVYDPRNDIWTGLPDMPRKLGSVGVAAAGGKLHLIGGRDSRTVVTVPGTQPPVSQGFGTVRTHLVYDPARQSWTQALPLPVEPRDHLGIAVLGDSIHVFGGRVADVADNLARHDVYDTLTRRWTSAAPLPTPRSAGAAAVVDGRIVFAGGECKSAGGADPTGTYDDVTAYSPRTDRWSTLPALPQGRHAFGAARIGDRAYFVGGALTCGGGASTDTLELTLAE
ncbi:Kelch repeat-containing protein [Streptomyces sp. NPDC101062]|uniref:Kelch repeat-containing protein n=1 Tax=unclassified Streptomyces TaxID=2593676 RepID=UPI0037F968D4